MFFQIPATQYFVLTGLNAFTDRNEQVDFFESNSEHKIRQINVCSRHTPEKPGRKMKRQQNYYMALVAVTAILTLGCSSIDSLVQSVGNKFSKTQTEVDTSSLEEARQAKKSGDILLAEERYKEYVEKQQRSGDKISLAFANSQLGLIAHEKSDYKASNRYFEEALKLDPENLDYRGMYAESLFWQKEYPRAESLFRQAMQTAPDDPRFQIMLGHTLAEQKQYVAGQRYLKQALGEQAAYEEMAAIYDKHQEYEMAALAMTKAHEFQQRKRQVATNSPAERRISPTQSRTAQPMPANGVFAGDAGSSNAGYAVSNFRPGQQDGAAQVSQAPVAMSTPAPQQPTPAPQQQQQGQLTALQQVIRQQQNDAPSYGNPQYAVTQQASNAGAAFPSQYYGTQADDGFASTQQGAVSRNAYANPAVTQQTQPYAATPQVASQQMPQQQFAAQQPGQPYATQQPVMPTNQGNAWPPTQNQAQMNPAVPQSPGNYPPQQGFQTYPQQQENRPPYGFAATERQPSNAVPTSGVPVNAPAAATSTVPGPFLQNAQEIAYHPGYAASPSAMTTPQALPETRAATNPLAGGTTTTQTPQFATPQNLGGQSGTSQTPTFTGFQAF